MKRKIAFLDRDGVINNEVNYLYRIEDFVFAPKCIRGLKVLKSKGFQFAIVTNQAGIAKGYYDVMDYERLTKYYLDELSKEGIDVIAVEYCPHHPDGVVLEYKKICKCRKPAPAMIEMIRDRWNVSMEDSILVGDKNSDVEAGFKAGLSRCFLVETGHPIDRSKLTFNSGVYRDLYDLAISL